MKNYTKELPEWDEHEYDKLIAEKLTTINSSLSHIIVLLILPYVLSALGLLYFMCKLTKVF